MGSATPAYSTAFLVHTLQSKPSGRIRLLSFGSPGAARAALGISEVKVRLFGVRPILVDLFGTGSERLPNQ
jgi:hypothetical protein